MTYTGYQDIKQDPRKPALPIMLRRLDAAAESVGLTLDLPELTKARGYQARANDLRAAYTDWKANARDRATAAAREYATGKLDAAAVLEQVSASVIATGETDTAARQMIEAGAAAVEAEGAPLLHNITETRWLKVIRPAVAAALKHANAVADDLGINEPRAQRINTRSAIHPWAPTTHDLKDINVRHKWEMLEDALDKLDAAHAFADMLRGWGMLPIVDGRATREDYRWLHLDRLQGRPAERREFFLINRHNAEPGLYTAAELAAADAPAEEPRVLADAHAGNGGVREF
jgi:hypothetical protein